MAETQNELKLGIGTEEAITLKPTKVTIASVEIREVGTTKKAKKVICQCIHPDAKDSIQISSIKYEKKGKLEVDGLWLNKDSQGMIRKGSALATLMLKLNAVIIEGLVGKEIDTALDENKYLCLKCY